MRRTRRLLSFPILDERCILSYSSGYTKGARTAAELKSANSRTIANNTSTTGTSQPRPVRKNALNVDPTTNTGSQIQVVNARCVDTVYSFAYSTNH